MCTSVGESLSPGDKHSNCEWPKVEKEDRFDIVRRIMLAMESPRSPRHVEAEAKAEAKAEAGGESEGREGVVPCSLRPKLILPCACGLRASLTRACGISIAKTDGDRHETEQ